MVIQMFISLPFIIERQMTHITLRSEGDDGRPDCWPISLLRVMNMSSFSDLLILAIWERDHCMLTIGICFNHLSQNILKVDRHSLTVHYFMIEFSIYLIR